MNVDKYTKSRWLKGSDLPDGEIVEVTIEKAYEFTFEQTGDTKPIVSFLELDQELPLNKSQTIALVSLFGPDTDAWIGQRIKMMAVPSNYQGKPTIAIKRGAPAQPAPAVTFETAPKHEQEIPF